MVSHEIVRLFSRRRTSTYSEQTVVQCRRMTRDRFALEHESMGDRVYPDDYVLRRTAKIRTASLESQEVDYRVFQSLPG